MNHTTCLQMRHNCLTQVDVSTVTVPQDMGVFSVSAVLGSTRKGVEGLLIDV